MPDLGGEARELQRDGCGLSVIVLLQRSILIYILSVAVAPFFLNSTSGAFCRQACDSEILPDGLNGDVALRIESASMGDGIVWERACQTC